jgi:hypothetical protein
LPLRAGCKREGRATLGAAKAANVRAELRTSKMGVWRSGSACRLQRRTDAISPSCGDQQEQPFVQVSPEYSLSSKWQRLAPSGTGWTEFRMSPRPKIGQADRSFSQCCRSKVPRTRGAWGISAAAPSSADAAGPAVGDLRQVGPVARLTGGRSGCHPCGNASLTAQHTHKGSRAWHPDRPIGRFPW